MNKSSTLKDFEIIGRLGQGSFAAVFKVRRHDDKNIYALKKVKMGEMGTKQKQNALNEVRILASTSHPNIINYKQAFFDDQSQTLCIVMELAQGGDLLKKSNNHVKAKTYFTEAEIWKALLHMSKGLKALHDMNILHRDLKCANIFMSNDGTYKLGDLNVSKVSKRGMARTHTGTPYYTSPEVWKDRAYDLKCDIWSLGCVIYEMAALKPPFKANNLKQLYNKIQKGIFDRIPVFYSDELQNMIAQLIKVNPSLRPTTIEILNNSSVLKFTSPSDYYKPQPKQGNLLKTIIVPKNLKQLKDALPAAKYQIKTDGLNKMNNPLQQRASSVRSLRGNDSQKQLQILHSFRRMTPSRNRDYSYDNIKQKQAKQSSFVRPLSKQRQRIPPINNFSRNRSKQNIIDNSINRSKQRSYSQLKKHQAEISKNVERALQRVNKIDKLYSEKYSAHNYINKPRSQSVDKIGRVISSDRLSRVDRDKQKQIIKPRVIVPSIYRPSSRNNLDKKYLPPRMY